MFCTTATAHYEIYTCTLCHSYLHEKITSIIQSLNKSKIAVYFWDSFMIDWIIKMGMKIPWKLHKGELPEAQAYWSEKQIYRNQEFEPFYKKNGFYNKITTTLLLQKECLCCFIIFSTSPWRHLALSLLGLAFVLMLRPFFPELVMSTDLLSFEHPSILLFCLHVTIIGFISMKCEWTVSTSVIADWSKKPGPWYHKTAWE